MSSSIQLIGYRYSVYTRAVRMALHAKGVGYSFVDCDPFTADGAFSLKALHPFGRVPVLKHKGFCLYETQAILDYIEAVHCPPTLTPDEAKARARMRQVMGIADNYLYVPLVRQAFSHGVFRPIMGEDADPRKVEMGLSAAAEVLDALDDIADEGNVLYPGVNCLSDCLLWPMLDYFQRLDRGSALLKQRKALVRWADWMASTPHAIATRPRLSGEAASETVDDIRN